MKLGEIILRVVEKETGIRGVTEHRFHPPRRWKNDVAWPEHKLAIEIEGGTWSGGRHVRGTGYVNDMEKYNRGQLDGWIILRYTPQQITRGNNQWLRDVKEALGGKDESERSGKKH